MSNTSTTTTILQVVCIFVNITITTSNQIVKKNYGKKNQGERKKDNGGGDYNGNDAKKKKVLNDWGSYQLFIHSRHFTLLLL